MKIILVITELNPGGAERNLSRLALGLREEGHQVDVISLASPPINSTLPDLLRSANVETIFLNCNSRWAFPKAFWRLRKVLQARKPDVVQSYLYHANLLCSMVLNRTHTKHFVGLRVSDPRSRRYKRLARYQKNWSGVICVSADVRRHVAKFFTRTQTMVVIPNGVEMKALKTYSTANWPSDVVSSHERLVFVGRLDYQKGIDSILEYAPDWLANNKRHIYIIGDGPLRKELEAKCRRTELADAVHFLGYRDDALAFVSHADLFLFPSRWEGMPNAVMEAMALGRPVCATPVEGIQELLSHDDRQIAKRDSWGNAVTELLSLTDDERREIGEANQRKISRIYTTRQMVERYLETYNCV